MKPENRQIFEENLTHWETLTKAGYLKHLSGRDRSNLVKAMNEEFQPGYTADLWCPTCVSNMILHVYRRYHEFIAEEKRQQEEMARMLVLTNIPAPEEPVKTVDPLEEVKPPADPEEPKPVIQKQANFPSHKQNRRR